MNYAPNERQWFPGDLVLHDADAKRAEMLMLVVFVTRGGLVRTRYLDYRQPRTVYENRIAVLHDPARFGVAVPGGERIEGRLTHQEREIARLRAKLGQIAAAVGDEGGRCINCDLVRTLARVGLEGA